MIRLALPQDMGEIKKLWQEVFDEDSAVCDSFFDTVYKDTLNPVAEVDGEIVSSLFLIPCKIGEFCGNYVYCALTRPDCRRRGYMKSLLDFSYSLTENKDFLLLVPASEGLFKYYEKCGFSPYGVSRRYVVGKNYPESFDSFFDCELEFNSSVADYWKKACVYYGGEALENGKISALMFKDGDVILRNAKGKIQDFLSLRLKGGAVIEGSIDKGELKTPAMIKTENEKIKNYKCLIGITLE